MFWFSFLFAEISCAQNELAILLGSRHTISVSMGRAHFILLYFFDPFTPSPISFFSSYCSCDSVCPANLYSYLYPGPILVLLCIYWWSFAIHIILFSLFSSQDYEILRWLQVDISKYGTQHSLFLLNSIHHLHRRYFIHFTINKLLGASKSFLLQTILHARIHTCFFGSLGKSFPGF